VISEADLHRAVLQKYGLQEARDFLKISRRLDKERSTMEYLKQKQLDTEDDLIQVTEQA